MCNGDGIGCVSGFMRSTVSEACSLGSSGHGSLSTSSARGILVDIDETDPLQAHEAPPKTMMSKTEGSSESKDKDKKALYVKLAP